MNSEAVQKTLQRFKNTSLTVGLYWISK